MRIALCQINPTIGDFDGTAQTIREAANRARSGGAELVVFSELCIPGYPPKDLLENDRFVEKNRETVEQLARWTKEAGVGLVVGFVDRNPSDIGKRLFNAAALLAEGRILSVHHKALLPTYDVFDESRYFEPAETISTVSFRGMTLGISICEDMWNQEEIMPSRLYRRDPIDDLVAAGAELIINLSASPFSEGKPEFRAELVRSHAEEVGCPFLFCNQVGGNDDLIFDGNSVIANDEGRIVGRGADFEEDILHFDTETQTSTLHPHSDDRLERVHRALLLGIRDYMRKTGFRKALVGLSGGIDSALTVTLAAQALGPANVLAVGMPSRFSSSGSVDDSRELCKRLGVTFETVGIEPMFEAFLKQLDPIFGDRPFDVAEENIQARIRGVILMAISNKLGHLLLSTGNKSELAVGYCTLYGDMSGGLAVISDLPKTEVYALARWINREKEWIPEAILTKAPSAELRADQTDQDALPPYDLLDRILDLYIEQHRDIPDIVDRGLPAETVRRVVRMVDRNEYKRKQAPLGLRVTSKAFGPGRRVPIAKKYER